MSWEYSQASGQLTHNGAPITTGYSGVGVGLNNPTEQETHNVGPIPRGSYAIGPMRADGGHMGPNVLPLTPDPENEMFGRDAFFIHGDKIDGPPHTASNGCIIIGPQFRQQIATSGDNQLVVT